MLSTPDYITDVYDNPAPRQQRERGKPDLNFIEGGEAIKEVLRLESLDELRGERLYLMTNSKCNGPLWEQLFDALEAVILEKEGYTPQKRVVLKQPSLSEYIKNGRAKIAKIRTIRQRRKLGICVLEGGLNA